ncbi:uncharacterized protein LOC142996362 [Genypterus blacodes]|uniref:uncharacterized protein LOC142996362 n=1 Tax=Genypterus blacodes TaxID=154954 RepID=UPI003F7753BB
METGSFQSQLVSVMEVLAKAAVAEINRRVDDSCAVLRLEICRSQRDIDALKKKCEVMEAELRRSRIRARRRVFCPSAAERFSPSVKMVLKRGRDRDRDRDVAAWDAEMDAEGQSQSQKQSQPVNEGETIQIKEECEEDEEWRTEQQDKLVSGAAPPPCFEAEQQQPAQPEEFVEHYQSADNPATPGSLLSHAESYITFPEQPPHENEDDQAVKDEEDGEEDGPDENTAPLDSAHKFVVEDGEGQLWPSDPCGDDGDGSFSYSEEPYQQIPPAFTAQSGLASSQPAPEVVIPRMHSVGKSYSIMMSAARAKRRARAFGCKRTQLAQALDEGHNTLINALGQSSSIQQPTQQYGQNQDLMAQNPAGPAVSLHSRSGFGLMRRMRTPWRSGVGEKRFSCTYCDKSFMRFSQLKEHLRSHTGEKPFSCLQCGRSFTKQCNLIRHAVVHSGEKPYECALCGKCFTQRSSMKSHQKAAH